VNGKRVQKKTEWTAEDRERRRKVRELFRDKPTIDQLVAIGELSGNTVPMSLYLEIQQLLHELKKARETEGLSLADIAGRTGMDKAVLSKMENGQHGIPTLPTLARYAQAVGLRLALCLSTEKEEKSVRIRTSARPNSSDSAK
jgi:ribosome-binding protein aMBF1 (putative translation factor)